MRSGFNLSSVKPLQAGCTFLPSSRVCACRLRCPKQLLDHMDLCVVASPCHRSAMWHWAQRRHTDTVRLWTRLFIDNLERHADVPDVLPGIFVRAPRSKETSESKHVNSNTSGSRCLGWCDLTCRSQNGDHVSSPRQKTQKQPNKPTIGWVWILANAKLATRSSPLQTHKLCNKLGVFPGSGWSVYLSCCCFCFLTNTGPQQCHHQYKSTESC